MDNAMDRLWAPWRINYIRGRKNKGCVFCSALKAKARNYTVFNTKHSSCVLNIFPYNNGHLMVSPKRHTSDLAKLNDGEILDLFRALNKAKGLLKKVLNPDGFNIGINLSKSAGAGITSHIHIHIVPRWTGDTNFMPVVYGTKIISQSLKELYKKLKYAESKTD